MMLGPIHIGQPGWLLLPLAMAPLLWQAWHRSALPGAWSRSAEPGLVPWLRAWTPASQGRGARLLAGALVSSLALALAQPGWGTTGRLPERPVHGRLLVIDAADADTAAHAQFTARQLVSRSPGIPTGVIVVAGDAYDIVPMTADPAQLERYLRVIDPAIIPVPGREPGRGIARAMAAAERSRLAAVQIVLFSRGDAPASLPTLPRLGSRLVIVLPAQNHQSWRAWADHLGARLIDTDSMDELNDALAGQRDRALADAIPIEQRRGFAPWLLMASVPLWLLVFFREEMA